MVLTNTAETEVIERPTSGIAENSMRFVCFYPNPVKDMLYINGINEAILKAEVYDINGRLCVSAENPQNGVGVNSLKAGFYFVKIITSSGTFTQKIIKE